MSTVPFNTMHVFQFGECQVIDQRLNKSAPSDKMITLPAFVDYVTSLCPPDVTLTPYFVIHTFYEDSVRYIGSNDDPNVKDNFIVEWADLDTTTIFALVDEIKAYTPEKPKP